MGFYFILPSSLFSFATPIVKLENKLNEGIKLKGANTTLYQPIFYRAEGEVGLLFNQGYIGTIGQNTGKSNDIKTFATLGISKVGFFQPANATGTFGGTQGNDLAGTIKIYFANGTVLSRTGSVNWRETNNGSVDIIGLILDSGQPDHSISYGSSSTFILKSGTTSGVGNNIGLKLSRSTISFSDGQNRSGNAATSQVIGDLNTELSYLAKVSTVTMSTASIVEGNNLVYTVTFDKSNPAQQIFDFSITGSATSTSDYSTALTISNGVVNNGDGTITVPSGVTSFTVTIATVDDTVIESTETVILTVGSKLATGNILDNDTPNVSFTSTSSSGLESVSSANATVDLSVASGLTVTVDYVVTGTATGSGTDYTLANGTLTFNPADVQETITIASIVDDAILEANETVIITLSNPSNANLGANTVHTYTINNDDTAAVTIADVSGAENGGTITVTATLDNAVQGGFTVDMNTADGTATIADSDYTAVTGQTLTFTGTAGETQTFTITPTGDTKFETNETVTVSQSNLAATSLAVDITDGATVTLNNDDSAAVTIADVSGAENGGTITVTATLDNAVQGGFTVDMNTADGTATIADSDYIAVTGQTLTFTGTAGETQTFTITPTGDTKFETNETVTVSQSNLAATSLAVDITDGATVTLNNDDTEPTVTLSVDNSSIAEATGTAAITATLSNLSINAATVTLAYSGTATSGTDYNATASTSITIPAGSLSASATTGITAIQDANPETNETIIIDVTNVTNGTENGTQQQTITIIDDDTPNVSFTSTSSSGLESVSSANATVDLSVASGLTVTVDYVVTGTATGSGTDYTLANGTLTFNPADVQETITIASIVDDAILEANETVIITLSNPSNANLGANTVHTYTINNDDTAAVTIADVSGAENGGTITVTATLDNAVQGGFTVDMNTADGTATIADSDYTAVTGQTLTFTGTAGETQTFTITPTGDTKFETNETVTVSQSNLAATSLAVDITDGATVTLNNDDSAAVTIADVSGAENGGTITVTATLDNAVQGGFTVDMNTADGTATIADSDYIAVTGQTLTFTGTAGETQTFTITPTGDTKFETNETVTVSQGNLAATSLAVDITDGATVTLNNDDSAAVTIADVSGAENGGTITVTATLDNAVQGGFTVDMNTADGTATIADSDYIAVTGQTLTFTGTAGETQTFTITPTGDTKFETNETVTVSQSNLAATSLAVDITDGATVTLNNDDSAAVTIADVSGAENGGTITVTATLDNAVQGGFTVDMNTADGTATIADSDYIAVTGQTLTFTGTAGETQTFTITPTGDTKFETNETVTVSQSNLAATSLAVDITDGATVTLNNDDSAAVTIADVSGAENGGTITVTATLDNAVQGGFTVDMNTADGTATIADSDYIAVTGQTLTFTGTAGETQTFTITPTGDTKFETNETVTVSQSNLAATSLAVDITDGAIVTLNNDDSAGITITPNNAQGKVDISGNLITTEAGATNTFKVFLNAQPTGNVTVAITGLDATEGSLSASSLTFTTSNWNTAQTVTVTGIDDPQIDGDIVYTLTATASGGGYNNQTRTVGVVNQDNDTSPPVSVNSITVNEASPTAVFEVSGAAGQLTTLALANGTTTGLTGLEYYNGTAWVAYTSGTVTLNSSGKLLVRTSLSPEQEAASDNGETFTITATNTGGTAAAGTGAIKDDGTGTIFNEDGTENTTAPKDDDRVLTVNSITVNEASPTAVFEVSGAAGQLTTLALANGTTTGLTGLEYYNGTAWVAYTSGTVTLNSSGKLLVRTSLSPEQEAASDNGETFTITATNTGGTAAAGTGAIKDDGTGTIFNEDGTENTTAPKDDDRVYPQPDLNATYLGIPITGSIATNDEVPAGSTYGQPVPSSSNPKGATLELKPDGSYVFNSTKPGVYAFTVPVCNAFGDCVTTTLTITVKELGQADTPILNTDLGAVRVGEPVAIQTLGNDAPGRIGVKLNPASVQVTVAPVNGVVTVNLVTGVITYTPNAGFVGKDVYTYTVCDTGNSALCSTAIQEITVLSADEPNTITATDDFTTASAGSILSGNVIFNDDDLDGQVLQVTPQVVVSQVGVSKLNADGTFVFTPAKGFIGPTQFIYEVSTGGATPISTRATVYLLVAPAVLIAVMDNFKANEINGLAGGTVGNVLTNDLFNGAPVKAADVVVAVKNNGGITGLTIDAIGNLIVPKGTAPGSYVVTYTICDVNFPTNCSEAMVIVEVFHGVNLKITKSAISPSNYEGDQLEFLIRVENNGSVDASEVVVTDKLDAGFSYVTSTVSGASAVASVSGLEVRWTFATLAANQVAEITVRVKANPLADGREKLIANTAKVSSPARELSPNDNSSTTSVAIKPFFLSNVITPNGDGKNDAFVINGLGKFASNELIIFDRWGSHVFQKKGYQNDWTGQGLVAGTYFYVLSVVDPGGAATKFKGWIQLIRE